MDLISKVFSHKIRRLCLNTRGATAIEYALIAMSIAIVIIGAVNLVGQDVSNAFGSVATGFQ